MEAARSGRLNRLDEIVGSNVEFSEIFEADSRFDYLTYAKLGRLWNFYL